MFEREVIAQAICMYLYSLSLNNVSDIFRSWFEIDVFAKDTLIEHIESYADEVPGQFAISAWLKPVRSGYYALDGTWLKYRGKDIVLLILFDVKTLDIANWRIFKEENRATYDLLLLEVNPEIPVQLCIFHKYSRAGQLIPFVRIKNEADREIKRLVEQVPFTPTKDEALANLAKLQRYVQEHQGHKKLKELLGVLKRNFDLLLARFDHPEMSPCNNVLEGFNYIVKRRTKLMKGFKKPININKWLKLILTDWRFHVLRESQFKARKNKTPLELAGCKLPKIHNWLKYLYENFPK